MKPIECIKFEHCGAVLCPLDEGKTSVWYPEEPICNLREQTKNSVLVKNQRKITKKSRYVDSCYTKQMIDRKFTITKAVKGIEPDRDSLEQEDRFMKKRKTSIKKCPEGGYHFQKIKKEV